MKITVEDVSPTRKTLVVNLSVEEIAAEEKTLAGEWSRQARLPGFRPGKAPVELVRKRFAADIGAELERKLVSKAYEEAVKESKLNIFQGVGVAGDPIVQGKEGLIKITVDLQPEFELPEYKGLAIQVPSADVPDADVESAIKELLLQRADYEVVERAAAAGDFVKLNYTGTLNGQPIAELVPDKTIYGTQQSTWEEVGAKDAPGVKTIIDGLAGLKAGDKKDFTHTFPSELDVPALAGQTANYAVEVLEVREKRPAQLDAAFLKSLQCSNEEQLRERVRDDLKSRKEQMVHTSSREQVVKAITGAVDFALPESAVENETQALLREHLQKLVQQGVPETEFEKHKDELYDGARKAAAGRVKLMLLLLKIAEKEGVKVENEDLQRRIMQEAAMSRQKPEQLVKQLRDDHNMLTHLQRTILHTKTLDLLVAQAKVTAPAPAA